MLVVFGLNKDIWNQIGSPERLQYAWAGRIYLLSCVLSAAAGIRFMQQLSDSIAIGIFGGLLVGYIVAVVVRIALITMVSLPLHPSHSTTLVDRTVPEPGRGLVPERSRRPNFSILFRMFIIALMSLVVALPVASLIGYETAEAITSKRRSEVIASFKANHPEMTREQDRILLTNLQADHFPIYVYQSLTVKPIGVFSIWFTAGCFLIPFFMLWHLRSSEQFQYAKLNRDLLVRQIETDYTMTLERSKTIQQRSFGLTETVLPNQAWLDPPFNTRSINEQSPYTIESETAFYERLKTL